MTPSRWVLTTCYGVFLIVSIILVAQGSKIGMLTGLLLVASLLVIWCEARQGRADREMDRRG